MARVAATEWFNPSALYRQAVQANKQLASARKVLASALGAKEEEIFFNSGGTEGVNTAIYGSAGKRIAKTEIIVSAIEHAATYRACQMAQEMGARVTFISPNASGVIEPEDVWSRVTENTRLVSIMHVNNETGAVNDIARIANGVKEINRRTLFHSDGVQAFLKVPMNLSSTCIDLYNISGHKVRGPRGTGALYVRKNTPLMPLMIGGGQESDLRSGTENVPGIVGLATAVHHYKGDIAQRLSAQNEIHQRLIAAIEDIPDLMIHARDNACGYVLSMSAKGVRGETVLHILEEKGILIGTGSACNSHKKQSRVLSEMKIPPAYAEGTVRISFPLEADFDQVDRLAAEYRSAVMKLREFGRK
jgi:cysteine desulfurase